MLRDSSRGVGLFPPQANAQPPRRLLKLADFNQMLVTGCSDARRGCVLRHYSPFRVLPYNFPKSLDTTRHVHHNW